MKEYTHFFGVDVAKKTIDITLCSQGKFTHKQFGNNSSGMKELKQWVDKQTADYSKVLFCMEATGLYCFPLTQFLATHSIDTWIEHAAQIKRANALNRGKNDKVDSMRIAQYATKNLDRLRLWKPMSAALEKIKHLASLRERLVETKKRLYAPIQEFEQVGNTIMAKMLTKTIQDTLSAVDEDLKKVEDNIQQIVKDDQHLNTQYGLVTSVTGIGFVTAINLMVYTNGFTAMNDARKLACYCGVAPFEYSSGTSVRGKTKVHYMANKKLKCNLHMASLTAVKADADMKAYYEKKVGEGKSKMSVLNAVKNKLLARVIAVINRQEKYVKKKPIKTSDLSKDTTFVSSTEAQAGSAGEQPAQEYSRCSMKMCQGLTVA